MKKLLIFALPGGALLLLAWWWWSRRSANGGSTTMQPSTSYAVGATVTTDQGTFTKQSDADQVPDGTPGAQEIWSTPDGRQWFPTLAFSQGTSAPAFMPFS